LPEDEYTTLTRHEELKSASYISPLLISDVDYFKIYEDSLSVMDKKCAIRDYMDVCQMLENVVKNGLEGDIAEFGSYWGHSGYLMARILSEFKSKKQLFMFDMFEQFPMESKGVDAFWNETCSVDFEDVKRKFVPFEFVHLVKGDFTETLEKSPADKLCFVYIDCDSYRGTKYVLEHVFDDRLVKNGVVVIEDYGHAQIVGSRLAFHEFFDGRNDGFKFFSQFSGLQIVVKN